MLGEASPLTIHFSNMKYTFHEFCSCAVLVIFIQVNIFFSVGNYYGTTYSNLASFQLK